MAENKQNKRPNVPPLRFPEFTEPWERKKVSDILDFYSTNSLSWEQLEFANGDLRNLHYGMIHVGLPTLVDLAKDELPNIKQGNVPRNYELCIDGDVAFADASEDTNDVAKAIELINTNGQQVVFGLHTIHGRDNKGLTAIGFKGYAFASKIFHDQIKRIAQGTKIFSISSKNFAECYIGLPTLQEQRKIAHLLSIIDRRIAVQNKIIAKLESLIKGICRVFHDNTDGWLQVSFSELGADYGGLSNKTAADFGDGKPFITYLNVYTNRVVDESQFQLVNVTENESQNKVKWGDVLFTLSSETPDEVAVGSVYLGSYNELYLNSFCFGIHIESKPIVFQPYLAYLISSYQFRKWVFPLAQGSTRFNLHTADFMKKKFLLPPLEEQKKLYKCLNSISSRLAIETSIMKDLQELKQSLLHQMLI